MSVPDDTFVTTGVAARLLGVTPQTVARWIDSGRLPAFRTLGGHRRIARADLDRITTPTPAAPR